MQPSSAGQPSTHPWLIRSLAAWVIVVVPVAVMVRMVLGGGSALTGRVGRHSTARLAVVAAARLTLAQLDESVGRSHPQLGSEGGVVGDPVGQQGPWTWSRPRFLTGLWHNPNSTTNAVAAPVRPPLTSRVGMPGPNHVLCPGNTAADLRHHVMQPGLDMLRARMLASRPAGDMTARFRGSGL